MFDHVNYDVSDLERSSAFFEKVLAPLGYAKLANMPEYGVVGFGEKRPQFWLVKGQPHAEPSEFHVCFSAKTREQVDAFYRTAITGGGRDNGSPGVRNEYHENYYGAFVLDPDGINIEAVCHSPE